MAAIKALNDIDDKACLDPAPLVPGSAWTFDTDKLQLNVTLPQIYIDVSARGYINPSRWDEGINALMVNYDFSGSSTVHSNEDDNNDFYYLNLRNGANLGAWRLRNYKRDRWRVFVSFDQYLFTARYRRVTQPNYAGGYMDRKRRV